MAAWSDSDRETDPRRWGLAHAILAPNAHNLQSWLVSLDEPDTIVLYMDRQRLLPETEPFDRQLMMSQGTFLELLDIASRERGYRARIAYFPDGPFDEAPDRRAIARVTLVRDPAVARDELFAQIVRRRTNRAPYLPTAPTSAETDALRASVRGPVSVGLAGPDRPEKMAALRDIAREAWRIELTTPGPILESYRVLRVGPEEISRHRDGVSVNEPMARLVVALGLLDRTTPPPPDSYVIRKQVDDFNRKIDATPAFFWLTTSGNDRAAQLEAGRAYARTQLAATAQGLSMHPLQQALQEYPQQAGPHAAIRAALGVTDPAGTVQMWARLGRAPAVDPAPRRGLDKHILPA